MSRNSAQGAGQGWIGELNRVLFPASEGSHGQFLYDDGEGDASLPGIYAWYEQVFSAMGFVPLGNA